MFSALLLSVCLLWSSVRPAAAQVRLETPSVRVDLRYDVIDGAAVAQRLQGALRWEQHLRLSEPLRLIGFVATGSSFSSRWYTVHNFRTDATFAEAPRPRLRQFYVQWERPAYRLQAGAIPPVKAVISPTGLDPAGWIDGVRAEWYPSADGTVEMVLGRLGNVNDPGIFQHPTVFVEPSIVNYAELEISQHLWSWLRAEASAEYLRDPYLRGELRWTPQQPAEAFLEALFNTDTGALSYGSTLTLDPVILLGGSVEGIELFLRHAFIDSGIGLRGELADDFFTFGHSVEARLQLPLWREGGLSTRLRLIAAEREPDDPSDRNLYTRFTTELRWRFPLP